MHQNQTWQSEHTGLTMLTSCRAIWMARPKNDCIEEQRQSSHLAPSQVQSRQLLSRGKHNPRVGVSVYYQSSACLQCCQHGFPVTHKGCHSCCICQAICLTVCLLVRLFDVSFEQIVVHALNYIGQYGHIRLLTFSPIYLHRITNGQQHRPALSYLSDNCLSCVPYQSAYRETSTIQPSPAVRLMLDPAAANWRVPCAKVPFVGVFTPDAFKLSTRLCA